MQLLLNIQSKILNSTWKTLGLNISQVLNWAADGAILNNLNASTEQVEVPCACSRNTSSNRTQLYLQRNKYIIYQWDISLNI